jgi:hypothetical protein
MYERIQRPAKAAESSTFAPSRPGLLQRKLTLRRRPFAPVKQSEAPPIVHEVLRSPGQPLNPEARAFMEPRFGHDFGKVRVRTGPRTVQAVKSVNAVAYTVGRDIVLGRENVAPDTRQGRELIAHELTHVVQQSERPPSEPGNLRPTRLDDASEQEAHSAAAVVARGGHFQPQKRIGVALARQMDAGVPADAGMSFAPPDAGPVPAVPAWGAAPVRAPSATISAVSFRGTANRIAPTRSVTVPITVNDLPPGRSVRVDVEGSGGANGTATVTSGTTLAGSGDVTIRGGIQTTPGKAGNLRIRATVDGGVVGHPQVSRSLPFPLTGPLRGRMTSDRTLRWAWRSRTAGRVTAADP